MRSLAAVALVPLLALGAFALPGEAPRPAAGACDEHFTALALPGAPDAVAGDAAEAAAALPPPVPLPCSGIRPGARFGGGCTANWVFRNTTNNDTDYYIGTAGHCTFLGHRPTIGGVAQAGTTVFVRLGGGKDFAVVHIDENKEHLVNPSMCHWGGPEKAYADAPFDEQRLERTYQTFGWGGWWFGQPALQAKRGVRLALDGSVSFAGPVAPGDSGSPIMLANGLAWGVVTHALHVGTPAAYGTGTPVGYGMLDAGLALGIRLELVTAPLA